MDAPLVFSASSFRWSGRRRRHEKKSAADPRATAEPQLEQQGPEHFINCAMEDERAIELESLQSIYLDQFKRTFFVLLSLLNFV